MQRPAMVRELLRSLAGELCDTACPNTQELLNCDHVGTETLIRAVNALVQKHASPQVRASLHELRQRAHKEMARSANGNSRGWRRTYTDACLLLASADVLDFWSCGDRARALSAISSLDHAIVIAGAPGEGRLDLILHLIKRVQADCFDHPPFLRDNDIYMALKHPRAQSTSVPIPSATHLVPGFDVPPSLGSFISRFSERPFVLPGFLFDWPALNEHPWGSLDYLRTVAGPGRVVPVEVGSDYRSDEWTQKMMPWDEFLSHLDEDPAGTASRPTLYLAQHSLFNQLPALRDDIIVPDYVYSNLEPPDNYPQYVPPANGDRLVLNAWLGPADAVSPAHTDPFFNFFGQVVGRKTVWLAPPEASPHMYPYPSKISPDQPRNPAANNESPSMSNTSRVDVLLSSPAHVATSRSDFPDFWEKVVPGAMSMTLQPGDLLFFPPGWWHSMRSEERSFSVSMWF